MRTLLRAFFVILIVVAAAFLLLGYWTGSRAHTSRNESAHPIAGTSGVDVDRARERGAEIGEKAAVASRKVEDAMGEAALTTKIKAKMALDDTVKARAINVTTNGSTVTISGVVDSTAEHDRAVALARETAGVSEVVDHMTLRR
jgi:hyperosmotically inducible periplasmic protein